MGTVIGWPTPRRAAPAVPSRGRTPRGPAPRGHGCRAHSVPYLRRRTRRCHLRSRGERSRPPIRASRFSSRREDTSTSPWPRPDALPPQSKSPAGASKDLRGKPEFHRSCAPNCRPSTLLCPCCSSPSHPRSPGKLHRTGTWKAAAATRRRR
jgi:hypothetical protein